MHPGIRVRQPLSRAPSKHYAHVKRCFDIVFSAGALIALSPVFAACAVAVKATSEGPVVFRQQRWGRSGSTFECYKFRTMLTETPPSMKAAEFDDRQSFMTPVGNSLRRWSLASVIIGTPGDGESTKSLSRSANSSLDLQLCERRPGLCCIAGFIITYLSFLSLAFFGGQVSALKRRLQAFDVVSDGRVCAVAQMACAAVPLAEDWTVAA